MNLLVTGGAGFIGSNFIHYWVKKHPDDLVVNLDLLTYAGNEANLADLADNDRYMFVRGDIANDQLVDYLLKAYQIEVIVNFAAESHNSRAIINPQIFFQTNVVGTQVLLESARRNKVGRFHHISTCEVYGDLSLETDEKFNEESPYRPRTPYNASKAGADMAVRAYFETFHLPVTISNCSNNYGPYQFPEKVIPHFVISALTGKKLPLYKSSKNRREWLHVDDHCRAIELILEKGKVGETYCVGSGVEVDVEGIADKVIEGLGLDQSVKSYVADRPGHDRRYLLDSTKIRRELGWEPTIGFDEGIKEAVQWYVDHKEWWEPLLERLQVKEDSWK